MQWEDSGRPVGRIRSEPGGVGGFRAGSIPATVIERDHLLERRLAAVMKIRSGQLDIAESRHFHGAVHGVTHAAAHLSAPGDLEITGENVESVGADAKGGAVGPIRAEARVGSVSVLGLASVA